MGALLQAFLPMLLAQFGEVQCIVGRSVPYLSAPEMLAEKEHKDVVDFAVNP